MKNTKPHIAILASPGIGHLIPALELAKRLVFRQSFKVTVFVVANDHASISNSKLLKVPSDLIDIVLLPIIEVDPSVFFIKKIMIMMEESVPFLKSRITKMEFRPTALIVDIFGKDALEIADEFNMLKYTFITSNAWFSAVMIHSPEIDRAEIEEHARHQKQIKIPGCKPIKVEHKLDAFLNGPNDPFYLDYMETCKKLFITDGVLVNSWDEIEPVTLKALAESKKIPIYPIGPIVRPTIEPVLGDKLTNWLDNQPKESVIYVSFGSGGTLSPQQIIELAWGLELSQQRFIWVVRAPIENDTSGSYFTVGNDGLDCTPNYLPDGFLTRTQNRGLVVRMWAPQVEILGHSSLGGFITHCGWNSTIESIVNGVPMIAWPLYAEQNLNAAMLTDEIGASIRPKAVDDADGLVRREEISSMVRSLLVDIDGEKIRARVKELKIGAAKALTTDGSSYTSLSKFTEVCIQHLKTKAYGA